MRTFAGGIAGWLVAILPLLGVNIAGYANVFDTETAALAGAVALVGGILLGSLVTGLIAGRGSETRAGGTAATLPAGLLAALLYIVSLIAIVGVAIRIEAAPTVVMVHPIRITGAIVFLGAMLLGMALLVGMVTGRRAPKPAAGTQAEPLRPPSSPQHTMARPPAPSQPRYAADSGQRPRGYADDSMRDQREASGRIHERDSGYYGDYSSQGRNSGSYDEQQDSRRGGTPSRPRTRYPSGPSGSQRGRATASRDDDGRGDWR